MIGKGGSGGTATFGRRLLLAVDAKGYGGASVRLQGEIQEAIPRLLSQAAEGSGLDRSSWQRQEAGDSELAVLPEGTDEPTLVDRFMRELEAGLRAFNASRRPEAWLRLRAAVHFGTAAPGPLGFVGRAPVEIGRILDSEVLRSALASAPEAFLVLAVSSVVFNDVVREAYTTVRAEEFREVQVTAKEYTGRVWIWVPGHDVRALPLTGPESVAKPQREAEPVAKPQRDPEPVTEGRSAPASDIVIQTFRGTVNGEGAVFGISK